MIEVNKEIGKMLRQKAPGLCVKTSHNRHYYAVETERIMRLIRESEADKVVYTYPAKEKKGE